MSPIDNCYLGRIVLIVIENPTNCIIKKEFYEPIRPLGGNVLPPPEF